VPGQINLDFADVRAVMKGMGQAVMGTGVGQGENRAVEAAQRAISNPLLEDSSIEGAKGVIVNITGGGDLSLSEASEATALITKVADPDANVIYGIVTDEAMGNAVKVTVIATGFSRGPRKAVPTPVDLANYMNPPPGQAAAAGTAPGGDFYRKTPNAKAAGVGSRFDLDVPAFLRRKGADGGGE
jgi:cell division protein FtsZ